jgi:hypothetical protein
MFLRKGALSPDWHVTPLRDIFEAHQFRIIAKDHGHIADLPVAAQIDGDPEFDVGSRDEPSRRKWTPG